MDWHIVCKSIHLNIDKKYLLKIQLKYKHSSQMGVWFAKKRNSLVGILVWRQLMLLTTTSNQSKNLNLNPKVITNTCSVRVAETWSASANRDFWYPIPRRNDYRSNKLLEDLSNLPTLKIHPIVKPTNPLHFVGVKVTVLCLRITYIDTYVIKIGFNICEDMAIEIWCGLTANQKGLPKSLIVVKYF